MPARQKIPALLLENRRIIFRNFTGAEGRFNAKGQRNFHVVLEEAEAEAMAADGWNVKFPRPREDGDTPLPHLPVKVRFDNYPPRVVLITSRGKTPLDESMVDILDWAEFDNIDMILNPSWYDVNGKSGYTAYLKSLYITLHEDELELKYADVPDSAQTALMVADEPETIQAKSEIIAIERGINAVLMSDLLRHANRELALIGEDAATIQGYLRVVAAFASMNHSGGSASIAIPVISELLAYNNLTPLTDDHSEWYSHDSQHCGPYGTLWQNNRNSKAFSTDMGRTYWLVDEKRTIFGRRRMHKTIHKET